MGTILAGIVGYEASAPLGLPEGYGFCCIVAGVLLVGIAFYFLPERAKSDIVLDLPAEK